LARITPYLYILLFLGVSLSIYSQENKTLLIEGSDSNSNIIIEQIGYAKELTHDSIYHKHIRILREKLDQLGFIHNEIDSTHKNDSTYYLKLRFNESIKKITLKNDNLEALVENLEYETTNTNSIVLQFNNLANFLEEVVNYYLNNGFPFIQVSLKTIRKEHESLSANLEINKNEQRTIDNIIVKGYVEFPVSFINQQFGIHKKDPFSKKKITQISDHVLANKFVSEIKKPEVLFSNDSTSLFMYLKREKSNFFDGLVGFSTSAENNKVQFYGNVDFRIQNSLNQGESLQLKWLAAQNQSQSLKLSLEAPFILNTGFDVGYNFGIHKQDTTFVATTHLIKTDYQLSSHHKLGFVLETENSNTTSNQTTPNIANYSAFFYGVSYTLSRPNRHPIFDKKLFISSQVSKGERDDIHQNKVANYVQYLLNISKNHNILIENTTELLISENYLENELFRIGGSSSIRGFDENSFFSDKYSYINTAYNYLLDDASYLSILADLGFLKNNIDSSLLTTYSFGIGFAQQTKIGLLGVQYFVGNTNKNSFDFSNSKLHIKLTQPF